ncbi:DUF6263 family protein [Nocardioidaceae bacterium SCSIO 66511]|nr:DUF6263 family protein [Nocardioidaceae bacterium SCSIO 66511]
MRASAFAATAALALTALTACTNAVGGGADDFDCAESPTVSVDDNGSGPKSELRFTPKEGDKLALDMDMDMSMSVRADGSSVPTGDIPTITMGMTTKIERVTDDEIETSFEYDKVDAGGDPTVESTLQTLVGTSGSITTDLNGVYRDASIDPAPGLDPTMETTLEQLEQQLANMTVPLPDEPVGEGADWEVETPIELNGLRTCNTYKYTLDELDGSEYTLDVEINQQMAPGPIEQNGVEAELVDGSSAGGGTMSGSLELPLAVSGSTNVDSSTKMEVEQGDDSQEVESDVGVDVTINERG